MCWTSLLILCFWESMIFVILICQLDHNFVKYILLIYLPNSKLFLSVQLLLPLVSCIVHNSRSLSHALVMRNPDWAELVSILLVDSVVVSFLFIQFAFFIFQILFLSSNPTIQLKHGGHLHQFLRRYLRVQALSLWFVQLELDLWGENLTAICC